MLNTQTAPVTFALDERTPKQRNLNSLINVHVALKLKGVSRDQLALSEQSLWVGLDDIVDTNGDGHSDPDWLMTVMAACVEFAIGNTAQAIKHGLISCDAASTDCNRAKSLDNLSEYYRALDNHTKALECSREAFQLSPHNDGVQVNLAIALYMCGQHEEADRLIATIGAECDPTSPGDVLGGYARFDVSFRRMIDLPAVRALIDAAA